MVVAERSRTGSHRWETDWCPKCKERLTFWYVSETRTRCAMCALEKDKTRGLNLRPVEEEAPPAPAPAPEPAPVPAAEAAPAPAATPAPEPEPQEPVWVLWWCPECRVNASFKPGNGRYWACMGCSYTTEVPAKDRGLPDWNAPHGPA